MTIHTPIESPAQVDKKYVVFKKVSNKIRPKISLKQGKNTYILNDVLKNRVLGQIWSKIEHF
jgi:hypothetical protein